ncbi:Ryanodine receptor 1 [Frankliniella fusca]|uniref:Ryanodine receptor 1 n=1 Tax=Frankliniella fusca TaxID=407009 RepID=A0AAE1HDY1_9NEOP|nr:Ryanodine receptor 1 [Frankliniella fusca]
MKTQRQVLTFEFCMSQKEDEFRRLTGLYQPQFIALLEFLGKDVADVLKYRSDRETPKRKKKTDPVVSTETRLLITLLRMRRGWDVEDLALFFGISTFLVSKIIYTWVQFMYFQFKRIQGPMFVSRHLQKRIDRPEAFKAFENFRVCIDTTEVRIQSPDNLEQQGNTYSDYKSGNVWLYLIGISCWGGMSFISPGFEGSMSDVDIYNQSGIREFLEPGDMVLADRGFRVEEECDEDGVLLVHPPFLRGRSQFTAEEEMLTKEVAKARIFVEHLVRKVKVFKVLKKVSNSMLHYLDQMVYVAGCLINFMPEVVKNKPKEDVKKKVVLRGQKKIIFTNKSIFLDFVFLIPTS